MDLDLAEERLSKQAAAGCVHGDSGLVAARLDAQYLDHATCLYTTPPGGLLFRG
jgi:hypothetical protein